jgi:thiol-disulfide isomerase/thioredoxin
MLSQLLEAGVVKKGDTGIRPTEAFFEATAANRATVRDQGSDPVDALGLDPEGPVAELGSEDTPFLVEYAALSEAVPDATPEEVIQWTAVLDQFRADGPPTEGAPEPFLTVAGEKLRSYVELFSPAIVYVWRRDCDPCEAVRADFEAIFDDPPGDIALLSVYGPDNSRMLHEEFDIEGGPTVLFVVDGRIDARLVGAHTRSKLEAEIEILRDIA